MTANERIEAALNRVGGTISDIAQKYDEDVKNSISKILKENDRDALDEIAYLSNIIVRLQQALVYMIAREDRVDEPDQTIFVDEEERDPSMLHGEALELTDEVLDQLDFNFNETDSNE